MPNVHLRDLPASTLEILKQAARTDGRSLNAELIHLLNEDAEYLHRIQTFLAQIEPRKPRRPVDLEELLREDRESRPGGLV